MKLTKEAMMRRCGLKEKDFEGVDFDAFVDELQLTEEHLEEFNGAHLLILYREKKEQEAKTDYTDIYRKASGKITKEEIPEIDVIIWEMHNGRRNTWMAADFGKKTVFGGDGDRLNACGEEERLAEMTEDDMTFIRKTVAACGIPEWDNEYRGTNGNTTGSYSWGVGFRLAGGKCISYGGEGVLNSGTPGKLPVFCRTMMNHFRSVPEKEGAEEGRTDDSGVPT